MKERETATAKNLGTVHIVFRKNEKGITLVALIITKLVPTA